MQAPTPLSGADGGVDGDDDAYTPLPADFDDKKRHRLAVIGANRTALLDARDNGIFDADMLESALASLDASQIALEMHGTAAA